MAFFVEKIENDKVADDRAKCTIVMYHYVRDMDKTDYPGIKGLLVKDFIKQIDYICKNYSVIKLDDYVELVKAKKLIPDNACILTFDDGFKDHYTNVFPILKSKKLPAVFFPITQPLAESIVPVVHKVHFLLAKIGSKVLAKEFNETLKNKYPELAKKYFVGGEAVEGRKYKWDDFLTSNLKWAISVLPKDQKKEILNLIFGQYFKNEKKFCEELYMNWDDMKNMLEWGMAFGAHTHTHPMLAHLGKKEQLEETKNSKTILEKGLKTKIKSFSYPYGDFDEITVDILKNQGFDCGLTADKGINAVSIAEIFALKRLDTNDLPPIKKNLKI